jgi:glycosyltransferase involved in cell wall biosynthesis
MGIRGIPANYGGFETFAEQLATRLVKRGHEVTVYGRSHYVTLPDRTYKGVNLVVLPTIQHKYLDTVVHTFLCVVHAWRKNYDVVLVCNAANALATGLARLSGKRTVINVDGIERKRKKWGRLGRTYYLVSEWLSTRLPHAVVTDARVIQGYYRDRYGKETYMIAYGAETERRQNPERLKAFGLEPERYVLYVSRLEPENNAHLVIEAFENVVTSMKLVIVGDAPYAEEYIQRLKATGDERVVFTGFVFGEDYRILQQNAYCYVHATEVGGTHPALIEAMGFGNAVLVLDTPENREVAAEAGIYYDGRGDLKTQLQQAIDSPELLTSFRLRSVARVQEAYSWEKITDQYEALFGEIIVGSR